MTRRYIHSRRTPRPRRAPYARIEWCRQHAADAVMLTYGDFHTPRIDELMHDFGMSRAAAYRWRAYYIAEMSRRAAA
jgi:hypothetical protein